MDLEVQEKQSGLHSLALLSKDVRANWPKKLGGHRMTKKQ